MKNLLDKVPFSVKLQIIEKWAKDTYGDDWGRHALDRDTKNFPKAVVSVSKTFKKNRLMYHLLNVDIFNEYLELRRSGMMFEFFPRFTGNYGDDKDEFITFYLTREKEWIDEFLKPAKKNGKNN